MGPGSHIFREAALRTTSFGIAAKGVRAGLGGVLRKGGGKPGGKFVDGGTKVAGSVGAGPESIPAARSLSSKDVESTGVAVGPTGGGCW